MTALAEIKDWKLYPYGAFAAPDSFVLHDRRYRPLVRLAAHEDQDEAHEEWGNANLPGAKDLDCHARGGTECFIRVLPATAQVVDPDERIEHDNQFWFYKGEPDRTKLQAMVDSIPGLGAEIERRDAAAIAAKKAEREAFEWQAEAQASLKARKAAILAKPPLELTNADLSWFPIRERIQLENKIAKARQEQQEQLLASFGKRLEALRSLYRSGWRPFGDEPHVSCSAQTLYDWCSRDRRPFAFDYWSATQIDLWLSHFEDHKPHALPTGTPMPSNVVSLHPAVSAAPAAVKHDDFWAYSPSHSYIFVPTGEHWPASTVNARLPPVAVPMREKPMPAATYLDQNRSVEQATWAPGQPQIIENRLIADGGWIDRAGCKTFNLYRPPTIKPKAGDVAPWVDHVRWVYPEEADHIIKWLAQRVQRPDQKINHALVLGGNQGIGKDTLLEPVKAAVGPWNCSEVFVAAAGAGPLQLVC
jgi:hypothetical protein